MIGSPNPGRRGRLAHTVVRVMLAVSAAMAAGACSLASAGPVSSSSPEAFARADTLRHGIAIWRWFGRPAADADRHYQAYVSDAELAQLRRWGFTSIRLPLGEAFLFGGADRYGQLMPDRVALLRAAIGRINAAGMTVVVDYHPGASLKGQMDSDAALRAKTVAMWGDLAKALSGTDPNRVLFELLNEPRFQSAAGAWNDYAAQLHDAARRAAPRHTLIVDSSYYASLDTLPQMAVLTDPNVIYTVHFYTPMPFTAQGTPWAKGGMTGLPWPSDTAGCGAQLSAREPSLTYVAWAVAATGVAVTPGQGAVKYCAGGWNAQRMDGELAAVADWSHQNQRPVWIGEFGVRAMDVPASSRLRWLSAATKAFARYRLPASLWSYDDCWGLSLRTRCGKPGEPDRMGIQAACATLDAIGQGDPGCVADIRRLNLPGLADSGPTAEKGSNAAPPSRDEKREGHG